MFSLYKKLHALAYKWLACLCHRRNCQQSASEALRHPRCHRPRRSKRRFHRSPSQSLEVFLSSSLFLVHKLFLFYWFAGPWGLAGKSRTPWWTTTLSESQTWNDRFAYVAFSLVDDSLKSASVSAKKWNFDISKPNFQLHHEDGFVSSRGLCHVVMYSRTLHCRPHVIRIRGQSRQRGQRPRRQGSTASGLDHQEIGLAIERKQVPRFRPELSSQLLHHRHVHGSVGSAPMRHLQAGSRGVPNGGKLVEILSAVF